MFEPEAFVNYIENLVADYPDQINFAVDNFDDLLDGKFYTALASGYNFRLIEPLFDNFQGEDAGSTTAATTGFYFSIRIPSLTTAAVRTARKDTFDIAKRIIARLIFDSRKGHAFFGNLLNRFESANFKKDKQTFASGEGFQVGYLVTFQLRFDYIESVEDLVADTNWRDLP